MLPSHFIAVLIVACFSLVPETQQAHSDEQERHTIVDKDDGVTEEGCESKVLSLETELRELFFHKSLKYAEVGQSEKKLMTVNK